MIDAIRQRFLARFVQSGRERVRRALDACEREPLSLATAALELHALAGEAALLELSDVAELAQAGEAKARSPSGTVGAAEACVRLLRELERAVAALEAIPGGSPEPAGGRRA